MRSKWTSRGNRRPIHDPPRFREIAISSDTRFHPCPPSRKVLKSRERSNSRDSRAKRLLSHRYDPRVYSNRSSNRSSITRLMSASHETSILIKGIVRRERRRCILSISPAVFTVKHECSPKEEGREEVNRPLYDVDTW